MSNPVRKFEQLAIPDFYFSAMENWGMVTYREAVGLTSYDSTPLRTIFSQLITQAHEYSHSYFGNLVTPNFWDVAWLKEGFATYFAYLSLGNLHEDWRTVDIFAVSELQSALLSDSGTDSNRTMNDRWVGSPSSAKAALDFVTYAKGASIIRMFADVLGAKPFRRAINSYLRRRKYESIIPEDFYQELDLVASELPVKIGELFDSWANQTNYPLVQAFGNVSQVTLSQRSFDFSGDTTAKRWWIPIQILTPTFESKLHWLPANNESLSVKLPKQSPWFVVNPRLSGYYRVDYEIENWQALITFLKLGSLESLPSVSRAALIDDAFNLARASLRNYSLPLTLIAYLKRERDYVPWITVSRIVSFLDDKLRDRPDTQQTFRRYVIELIKPIYEELTTKEKASDILIRKMHRELILSLACSVGLESCITTAKSTFDRWIANEIETIPKHFKSFIYRIGIINGSDQDWENLWNRFLQMDSYVDKAIMIEAIASTDNRAFIHKFLEFAIQPQSDIVKQYRLTIVQSVLNKNMTTTLKYIQSNLSKIISLGGFKFLEKIMSAFGERITTVKQEQEFMRFLDQNSQILGSSLGSGKKALKTANDNIKWISRCAAQIQEYIDKNLFVL
ncbi:aminopeptidase Ey-like [Phymastichus coffea]|uniref:aminopeptidase Ey-like n=1 Tax=Phymastichus coffea TaxID=108790 RepID=UPI00273C1B09|nr:aminopeptidase Ey-like [Phymastichus coffea]